MKSPNTSPRLKTVATIIALSLGLTALAGCSNSSDEKKSCYSVPITSTDPEFEALSKEYAGNYDVINKRIAASLIYLGVKDDNLKEFDNWGATSSDIRTYLAKQHATSVLNAPKDTDTIAFTVLFNKDGQPEEGGRILPFMDGTMAFKTHGQRDSYAHNTGVLTEIDCVSLQPIKIVERERSK